MILRPLAPPCSIALRDSVSSQGEAHEAPSNMACPGKSAIAVGTYSDTTNITSHATLHLQRLEQELLRPQRWTHPRPWPTAIPRFVEDISRAVAPPSIVLRTRRAATIALCLLVRALLFRAPPTSPKATAWGSNTWALEHAAHTAQQATAPRVQIVAEHASSLWTLTAARHALHLLSNFALWRLDLGLAWLMPRVLDPPLTNLRKTPTIMIGLARCRTVKPSNTNMPTAVT